MLGIFVTLMVLTICQGKVLILEARRAKGDHVAHTRSNSIAGKTVLLTRNETLSLMFCLRTEHNSVSIAGIVYSNDGKSEKCSVTFDRKIKVGKFSSKKGTNYGKLWNTFTDSGQVGQVVFLPKGVHSIKIECDSDDGIEIDVVKVDVPDHLLNQDTFECKLQCQSISALRFQNKRTSNVFISNATASQRSYPTKCAEEDNVHIPMYMINVANYTVTATLPTYQTFSNKREQDETNCKYLPPVHWKFENFSIPFKKYSLSTDGASIKFYNEHKVIVSSHRIEVSFRLQGKSKGHIDSEIGSFMILKIRPVKYSVLVTGNYIGRRNIPQEVEKHYLLPGQREIRYDFPDFTWTEFEKNIVTLQLYSIFPMNIHVDEFRMERRYMKPERPFDIYKSDELIIEGVDVDFWWREPEKMKATRIDNGESWHDVDYFRISLPVPWADGYGQVFVLYQDGNARLLRLPPSGLDWIPFGSSIIVGQTDPRSFRPSSPIASVEFDPEEISMTLTYRDGGSAKLALKVDVDKTTLTVSKIKYKRTLYFPFATFRSMYVEDGNSDCDRVMVDDDVVYNILDRWRVTQGRTFTFFRECESKHLTLSPDIRVEVTGVYN